MQRNRLVAATLGVVLSVGGMLATAGTAAADPGPKISASASSTCNDREKVVIKVTVNNRKDRAVSVKVKSAFDTEWVRVEGNRDRTVSIRTDRRSVDSGSVTVTSVGNGGRDVTAPYGSKRCTGDPRIEVTPLDGNHNGLLNGAWVKNTSSFDIRVRVVIGRQQESRSLAPGERFKVWANDSQRSGVAIATRRDDGKLHSTVKVFRA